MHSSPHSESVISLMRELTARLMSGPKTKINSVFVKEQGRTSQMMCRATPSVAQLELFSIVLQSISVRFRSAGTRR